MRGSARRFGITLEERGAKAVLLTGLIIAYGINSLATTLAACTFSFHSYLLRYWSSMGEEEHGGLDEDMSRT